MMTPSTSPFFDPGPKTAAGSLAVLYLRRDLFSPVVLKQDADAASDPVVHTRFGSFPHSTLVDVPWGSQVAASKVDFGGSNRRGKKRKREEGSDVDGGAGGAGGGRSGVDTNLQSSAGAALEDADFEGKRGANNKALSKVIGNANAPAAPSGFVYVLPPTPELWTSSLPHRTQVVYMPDYSYILQRLGVGPGCRIIEAGAGSGSFTHAAARAVHSGPSAAQFGKVFSFEFHEPRAVALKEEVLLHRLDGVVQISHRDVYKDGFLVDDDHPQADAIFLDLPTPWLALRHLTREPTQLTGDGDLRTPLNPQAAIRICTFSPCIEQVQRTMSALRKYGWLEIEMVEVMHRRIEVRRERTGLKEEGLRRVNATAASVDEAVERLKQIEHRIQAFHEISKDGRDEPDETVGEGKLRPTETEEWKAKLSTLGPSKHERREKNMLAEQSRKLYKEGQLLHRTEPEMKSHTSYLTFAVLPQTWSQEEEDACKIQF